MSVKVVSSVDQEDQSAKLEEQVRLVTLMGTGASGLGVGVELLRRLQLENGISILCIGTLDYTRSTRQLLSRYFRPPHEGLKWTKMAEMPPYLPGCPYFQHPGIAQWLSATTRRRRGVRSLDLVDPE